jgi:PII-like signaling protein
LNDPVTRLTVYFGERSQTDGKLVAEHLMAVFKEAGIHSAVLLRGGEGFGPEHGLRTAGRLTLSEDLPMTAVALGPSVMVLTLAREIRSWLPAGLVTVEGPSHSAQNSGDSAAATRLTAWSRRRARIDGRPAHTVLAGRMKALGASATIVLLGVDGVTRGKRHRAAFFSNNADVPVLVTGIWPGPEQQAIRTGLAGLSPELMVESANLQIPGNPDPTAGGEGNLACLTLYGGGLSPGSGIRAQQEILRLLRRRGAPGATAYLGLYGHSGSEPPHGDAFFQLARRVPVLTEIIDTVESCRRWIREIDDMGQSAILATVNPVVGFSRPVDRV